MSNPTTIQLEKIIIHGYCQLVTRKINAGQTEYDGLPVIWTGQIDVEFTPTQEKTVLPSGDDPRWGSVKGPVLGSVKGTFYGLPLNYLPQILGVKYSAADGMVVGDEDEPDVLIGMAFDQSVKHESTGAASVNKTILYKVELDLPTISGKTKGEGDNAVANIEISGKAWPAYYTKTGGSTGRRTYCTVNSTLNPDKFAANNNTIVWPSDFTADA